MQSTCRVVEVGGVAFDVQRCACCQHAAFFGSRKATNQLRPCPCDGTNRAGEGSETVLMTAMGIISSLELVGRETCESTKREQVALQP